MPSTITSCAYVVASLAALTAAAAEIPRVLLTKEHEALTKLRVGDTMPPIELPQLGEGARRKLSELYGQQATVVMFWSSDRRMAREQLADIGPDIVKPFGEAGVAVVGIAVNESAEDAESELQRANADFPNLLDEDGRAFSQIGREKLPRTYLLDPQGRVMWFDLEYSHATRRELNQALRAVTGTDGRPASAGR